MAVGFKTKWFPKPGDTCRPRPIWSTHPRVAIFAAAVQTRSFWLAATRALLPIFGARALSEIAAIFAATPIVAAIVGAIRSALVDIAPASVIATHVPVIRPSRLATSVATSVTTGRAAVAERGTALTAQLTNLAAQVADFTLEISHHPQQFIEFRVAVRPAIVVVAAGEIVSWPAVIMRRTMMSPQVGVFRTVVLWPVVLWPVVLWSIVRRAIVLWTEVLWAIAWRAAVVWPVVLRTEVRWTIVLRTEVLWTIVL